METLAVTAGRGNGAPGDPLNVPLVAASVFHAGVERDYAREGTATWAAFEEVLGNLEGGQAVAFASGMAAVDAAVAGLPVGSHVVAPTGSYSGTRALLDDAQARGLLRVTLVDVADTEATLAAVGDDGDTALLWVESPTNPMLAVADLAALAEGASAAGAAVVVDNTFATPLLQRPLDLGADVVVHSATKFIGGHSDLLLGVAVTRDPDRLAALYARRTLTGAVPGTLETWLALRGVRSLPVRLERAQANCAELARRLAADRRIAAVRYPGLPQDPGHARAARQMKGFGALLCFEPVGGAAVADAVCAATRVLTHATSLGGVESTLERRGRRPGEAVPPALIRVSVGIEHIEDLWADLDQALDQALVGVSDADGAPG